MPKLSKETKIELLELSKKITNGISFEDTENIEVNITEYGDGVTEQARSRVIIDITFRESK